MESFFFRTRTQVKASTHSASRPSPVYSCGKRSLPDPIKDSSFLLFEIKLEEDTTCPHQAKNLGICIQKPSNQLFTNIVSRLKSFQSWTKTSPTPVDLAEAGFFFTGCEDIVQCFYCGLKLRNWDVFDCPWVEHARHGRDCPHVYNVKGEHFYKRLNEIEHDGPSITQSSKSFIQCLYTDDLIYTTAGQALINMRCYKEQQIKNAIRECVTKKGNAEFSAVEIATILQNNPDI